MTFRIYEKFSHRVARAGTATHSQACRASSSEPQALNAQAGPGISALMMQFFCEFSVFHSESPRASDPSRLGAACHCQGSWQLYGSADCTGQLEDYDTAYS